ncbi:hypothetical protein BDQ12DRAFT_716586 [Crucibulum laeve]|uniref:Uncharacterized protein n=1 Tax=Crucibulum laeve TaxID=68775 RepID=A0A5C3LJL4_9AGAR|nr:hypothetical protein BDQ12DRAFT_716586 [Crucibulum laeve]
MPRHIRFFRERLAFYARSHCMTTPTSRSKIYANDYTSVQGITTNVHRLFINIMTEQYSFDPGFLPPGIIEAGLNIFVRKIPGFHGGWNYDTRKPVQRFETVNNVNEESSRLKVLFIKYSSPAQRSRNSEVTKGRMGSEIASSFHDEQEAELTWHERRKNDKFARVGAETSA